MLWASAITARVAAVVTNLRRVIIGLVMSPPHERMTTMLETSGGESTTSEVLEPRLVEADVAAGRRVASFKQELRLT